MESTVLFVDDEENVLNAIRRSLRGEKYRIETARNGIEALAILERQEVAIIVSDNDMPHLPGLSLLELVKKEYPHTIRMMLTAYANVENLLDGVNRAEVFRFLRKPFDRNDILCVIREGLAASQLSTLRQRTQTHKEKEKRPAADVPRKTVSRDAQGYIHIFDEEDEDIESLLQRALEGLSGRFLV